jgi:preprotein translocase subunit YajC
MPDAMSLVATGSRAITRRNTLSSPVDPAACTRRLSGVLMFFISDALAQTAPAAAAGPESMWTSMLFMVLIFVVFYFLLIRPQVKRQKEHKAMVDALNKGDEILTAGGLIGKITELTDQYATIQISTVDSKPVEISIQRAAVQTLLPKGTMKSI